MSDGVDTRQARLLFPPWTNRLPVFVAAAVTLGGAVAVGAVWYWFSPSYTDAGYQPRQPLAFSHKLHAGELGMDCRYCHQTVERAAHAAIPATQTCMACHEKLILPESDKLAAARISYLTDGPIEWRRVHLLPDFAYFDHSVHLAAGVGCASCHGRIDQMRTVYQAESLSMGFCLQCHRNPQANLRPTSKVTQMDYDPQQAGYDPDQDTSRRRKVAPPLHCSGCHR